MITQLQRMFWQGQTVHCLERCLAQGMLTDKHLAADQVRIIQETDVPIFLYSLRGERAIFNQYLLYLESGKLSEEQQGALLDRDSYTPRKRIEFFLNGSTYKDQLAWLLIHLNDAVEISKGSPRELRAGIKALDTRISTSTPPSITGNVMTTYLRIAEAHVRNLSLLHCAHTALAVERFRLAHNRWPESLDEVVAAKFLDKNPEDPFDGKRLRYRKTSDGVVVYSVGKDLNYAGDALDVGRENNPGVFRYEFRLWDEAHRRQPPRGKKDDKKVSEGK